MSSPLTTNFILNIKSYCSIGAQFLLGYFNNNNPNILPLVAIDDCNYALTQRGHL